MTEEKTADIGELVDKYALSIKRNAHEIPGMPFSVLRQTFAEFADELATLHDRIEREPVVKALEWREGPVGHETDYADSIAGEWAAWEIGGRAYYRAPGMAAGIGVGDGTIDTAKAAAQADYERRILSALASAPEPVGYMGPDAFNRLRRGDSPRETVNAVTSWPGSIPLYASPPAPVVTDERRFRLEWIAGARPPVHPEPMHGAQSFASFAEALEFFGKRASDARFKSLTEITTTSIDRSADVRAALASREAT